jgi:hypothetical protein
MSTLSWRGTILPNLVASLVLLGVTASAKPRQEAFNVPNGTILPVRLNHGINSKKAQPGEVITGRIMQDLPLPGGGKIPAGSMVSGTVVSTSSANSQDKARVTLRFDTLEVHGQKTTITTDLRALASPTEVRLAQIPETSPDFGTSEAWVTTRQVGGDEVYGWYGVVTDQTSQHVGTSVPDGVLVHVRAQPGAKCRGELAGENPVQALWVFSSDACGVYGYDALTIQHAGRSEPKGQIELVSNKGEVKLGEASGLLLRIER